MRHPFPRLLVLVPHRDARLPMRAWSGSLFAGGLLGAWSFPWVVPLAALDRPLPDAELRSIAGIIREHSRPNGGKFTSGPAALAPLPFATPLKPVFALGPTLDIVPPGFFPETFGGTPISPTVWGAALVYGPMPENLPAPPQIPFRAAALATMRFRPLPLESGQGDYSFAWKIGKPHWLPK